MIIEETYINGLYVITPDFFKDKRGVFYESFNQKRFNDKMNLKIEFVQDNISKSSKGVLRGLHFQTGNHKQAKLISVIQGKVQDVCLDLRKNSPTYGKYFSIELSEKNKKQVYIPRGFAHGFLVLEDNTIFSYKCDNYYNKDSESGIIFNDINLNINWNLPEDELIISEKDQNLPTFNSIKNAV